MNFRNQKSIINVLYIVLLFLSFSTLITSYSTVKYEYVGTDHSRDHSENYYLLDLVPDSENSSNALSTGKHIFRSFKKDHNLATEIDTKYYQDLPSDFIVKLTILKCNQFENVVEDDVVIPCTDDDATKFEVEYLGRTIPAVLSPKLFNLVSTQDLTYFTNIQGIVVSDTMDTFEDLNHNNNDNHGYFKEMIVLDEGIGGITDSSSSSNYHRQLKLNDPNWAVGEKTILFVCMQFNDLEFTGDEKSKCEGEYFVNDVVETALTQLYDQSFNKLSFNYDVSDCIYSFDGDFDMNYVNNALKTVLTDDDGILAPECQRNVNDYLFIETVHPDTDSVTYGGSTTFNGRFAQYNGIGEYNAFYAIHEIGHQLGLHHAGADGVEYGNYLDSMGSQIWKSSILYSVNVPKAHFSVASKHALYWINDDRVLHLHPHGDHNNCVQCVSSGVFTLSAYDNIYNNDVTVDENIFTAIRWFEDDDGTFVKADGVEISEQNLQSSIRLKGNYVYGGLRSLQQYTYERDGEEYYGGFEIYKTWMEQRYTKPEYQDLTPGTGNLLDGVLPMGDSITIQHNPTSTTSIRIEVLDMTYTDESYYNIVEDINETIKVPRLTLKVQYLDEDDDDVDGEGCHIDDNNCTKDNSNKESEYIDTSEIDNTSVIIDYAYQSALNGEYLMGGLFEGYPIYILRPTSTSDFEATLYMAHLKDTRDGRGEWVIVNDLDKPERRYAVFNGEYESPVPLPNDRGHWRVYNPEIDLFIGSLEVDVNECLNEESYECGLNFSCVNTFGAYSCECGPGFDLNGTECEDIDECLVKSHNCSSNASCSNTIGSFECACDSGFEGNGTECEVIDDGKGSNKKKKKKKNKNKKKKKPKNDKGQTPTEESTT